MAQANFTFRLQLLRKYRQPTRFLRALLAIAAALLVALHAPAQSQIDRKTGGYVIAVFGDSLSAGYQLPAEDAFPAVLEQSLRKAGHAVSVINASVSGDTSTGGLARLDWALNGRVDAVIVELGANDMLRGITPDKTREALDAIIRRIKARGAQVLLAGMVAAPGMGKPFEDRFNAIYPDLARTHGIVLAPFFLEGVAGRKDLNLFDGIHPNAQGVVVIVRNILPYVEKVIAAGKTGG